jgi:hypothetical protein
LTAVKPLVGPSLEALPLGRSVTGEVEDMLQGFPKELNIENRYSFGAVSSTRGESRVASAAEMRSKVHSAMQPETSVIKAFGLDIAVVAGDSGYQNEPETLGPKMGWKVFSILSAEVAPKRAGQSNERLRRQSRGSLEEESPSQQEHAQECGLQPRRGSAPVREGRDILDGLGRRKNGES